MSGTPTSTKPVIEQANTLLATVRGAPLTDEGLSRATTELAGYLLVMSQAAETREESRRNQDLARLMSDRRGQLFSTLLTDRVPRLTAGKDIVRQALNVMSYTGTPTSMSLWDRLQLQGLRSLGPIIPTVVGAGIKQRIRKDALPFLIPGESGRLRQAVEQL